LNGTRKERAYVGFPAQTVDKLKSTLDYKAKCVQQNLFFMLGFEFWCHAAGTTICSFGLTGRKRT